MQHPLKRLSLYDDINQATIISTQSQTAISKALFQQTCIQSSSILTCFTVSSQEKKISFSSNILFYSDLNLILNADNFSIQSQNQLFQLLSLLDPDVYMLKSVQSPYMDNYYCYYYVELKSASVLITCQCGKCSSLNSNCG